MTIHQEADLYPNVERLRSTIDELSAFTDRDGGGWARRVLSEPFKESRAWIAAQMQDAGLTVHEDSAGNLVGRLAGIDGRGRALGTGSHTDTVARGGRFDGIIGVLGAIEMVRRMREEGVRLQHDLVVIDFLGEEPNDFGVSCVGSRSLTGAVSSAYFDNENDDGRTLGKALELYGLDPHRMLSMSTPLSLDGFVELHIEQGPVLERTGTEIGVVTAIAGIERVLATFIGRADHAGTAAMADRKDALTAAAQAVLTVEQIGCSGEQSVATVGSIHVEPGASNVVPSLARFATELRSPDKPWLGQARGEVVQRFAEIAAGRGVEVDLEWLTDQDPVPTAPSVQDLIATTAERAGYSWRAIPSGAGHDAAHIATIAPTGMIFVPSHDGRSHCPEEWTEIEDIARGVHALGATLLTMDAR